MKGSHKGDLKGKMTYESAARSCITLDLFKEYALSHHTTCSVSLMSIGSSHGDTGLLFSIYNFRKKKTPSLKPIQCAQQSLRYNHIL